MPTLTLLTTKGEVHQNAGLNWGYSPVAYVRRLDAYIPLHIVTIRNNPEYS